MIDKVREERLEEARARCGVLIPMLDVLGTGVDEEVIQRASLVPLSPAAAQAAFNLAHVILMNMDCLAAILAGYCPAEWIATFANVVWPSAPMARARASRRPRPTTAERDRLAAEWLAGPAWDLGPEPEPYLMSLVNQGDGKSPGFTRAAAITQLHENH